MRHVPFVDSTGLHNLQGMIKSLQNSGVKIVLSGVNDSVMKDLKEHQLSSLIGESNILHSFDDALNHSIKAYAHSQS
jgi:SulP family sulfate permease